MIPAHTIDQIRESLEQGDQKKIVEITKFSQTFVNMVLNNKVNLNKNSERVLEVAMNLIDERKAATAKLEERIGGHNG